MTMAFDKISRLFLLIIILITVAAFCVTHNNTLDNNNVRPKRIEAVASQPSTLLYTNIHSLISQNSISDFHDIQVVDDTDLVFLMLSIMNLVTLFSGIIILISFSHFVASSIRRWILLDSNTTIHNFMMHFLKLYDDNNSASSFQFSH